MPPHLSLLQPPLDLDWPAEGNEWAHHLRAVLTESGATTLGHKLHQPTPDEPYPFQQFTASHLDSHLRGVSTAQGLLLLVAADDDSIADRERQAWADAVREALARLGGSPKQFEWTAVVAPSAGLNDHIELAEAFEVGGLRVAPAGVQTVEHVRHPGSFGWSSEVRYPMIVDSRSSGYDWFRASRTAARALHRLRALLSVAWDAHVDVLHAPQPISRGRLTLTPRIGPPVVCSADLDHYENWARAAVAAPAWLAQAWKLAEDDEVIGSAAGAHLEGLAIAVAHPSLALVAFVSAIEALGAKLKPPERCQSCRQVTEATSRFRQVVEKVADGATAAMASQLYKLRSTTAHAATLHGSEPFLGSSGMGGGPFGTDDDQKFESGLWLMRSISRKALLSFITDG